MITIYQNQRNISFKKDCFEHSLLKFDKLLVNGESVWSFSKFYKVKQIKKLK